MDVEREHQLTSKANIVIATMVAIYVMIWESWGFGIWWFLVIPALWFAASIVIALPFGLAKTAIAKRSMILAGLADWANYVVLVPATYFGLKWLNAWIYG